MASTILLAIYVKWAEWIEIIKTLLKRHESVVDRVIKTRYRNASSKYFIRSTIFTRGHPFGENR